jgi:hypothetical protein
MRDVVLTLSISDEAEARLRAKAAAAGVDVGTYATRYLEHLASPSRSLADLSGPIAGAVAGSGMTEDEISALLEDEKHAARAERRARQAG